MNKKPKLKLYVPLFLAEDISCNVNISLYASSNQNAGHTCKLNGGKPNRARIFSARRHCSLCNREEGSSFWSNDALANQNAGYMLEADCFTPRSDSTHKAEVYNSIDGEGNTQCPHTEGTLFYSTNTKSTSDRYVTLLGSISG